MTDGPLPPAIRISDAERQHAIGVLRDAVVEGRLTLEEYSDRVGIAVGARTDQEVAALVRDLPQTRRAIVPSAGAPIAHRAIFSHIVRRGPLTLASHTSYMSVFGTIDVDLREATLPGSEVRLDIRNIFGTVTVLVPEGVDVRMEGGGLLASEHVDISNTRLIPNAPVIHIRTSGPGGTVYVRTSEPRGWLESLRSGG
jgi:hypothetical protein